MKIALLTIALMALTGSAYAGSCGGCSSKTASKEEACDKGEKMAEKEVTTEEAGKEMAKTEAKTEEAKN